MGRPPCASPPRSRTDRADTGRSDVRYPGIPNTGRQWSVRRAPTAADHRRHLGVVEGGDDLGSSLDPAGVACPFLLAELELLGRPGGRPWELVDERDGAGHLEAGDVGLQ